MSEKTQTKEAIIKFIVVFIFAVLYSIGGTHDFGGIKALRRFVAPILLCGACGWYSRDIRYLVQAPFMMLSLSLGYGADELWLKILKRGVYGLANGVSTSVVTIWSRLWHLVIIQLVVCIGCSIALGVWGIVNARVEEFCLGVFISFLPVMSARRK